MVSPFKATMAPIAEGGYENQKLGVFNNKFVADCFMNEDAKNDWQKDYLRYGFKHCEEGNFNPLACQHPG